MGNTLAPASQPNRPVDPMAKKIPPECSKVLTAGMTNGAYCPFFDRSDRLLVCGKRTQPSGRGILLVNSFGAVAGIFHPTSSEVKDIGQLSDGNYVVLFRDGILALMDAEGKVLKRTQPGMGNGQIGNQPCALAIKNDQIFVADTGNRRLVTLDKTLSFVSNFQFPGILRRVDSIALTPDGDIVLSVSGALQRFQPGAPTPLSPYPMEGPINVGGRQNNAFYSDIVFDRSGNLWALTNQGFIRVFANDGSPIIGFEALDEADRLTIQYLRFGRHMRMRPNEDRLVFANGNDVLKMSAAFAALGLFLAWWVNSRTSNRQLAAGIFFFFTMEALQAVQYLFLASGLDSPVCHSLINQVLTVLGFVHICLQPYFCHVINESLSQKPSANNKPEHNAKLAKYHHQYAVIKRLCLIGGFLLFLRYPLSFVPGWTTPSIVATSTEWLRGPHLCTFKSASMYHLGWSVPMADGTYNVQGVGIHSFLMFAPFFALYEKRGMVLQGLVLYLSGPFLAAVITPNLMEQASIWCFFSIVQIAVMLFLIRETLIVNWGKGGQVSALKKHTATAAKHQ